MKRINGLYVAAALLILALLLPYSGLNSAVVVADSAGNTADEGGSNSQYNQTLAVEKVIEKLQERLDSLEEKGVNVTRAKLLLERAEEELRAGNITGARSLIVDAIRSMAFSIAWGHRQEYSVGGNITGRIHGLIESMMHRVNTTKELSSQEKQLIIEMLGKAERDALNGNIGKALTTIREAMIRYNDALASHKRQHIMEVLQHRISMIIAKLNNTEAPGVPGLSPEVLKRIQSHMLEHGHGLADLVRAYKGLREMHAMKKEFIDHIEEKLRETGVNQSISEALKKMFSNPSIHKRKQGGWMASPFIPSKIVATNAMALLKAMSWRSSEADMLIKIDERILTLIDEAEEEYYSLLNGTSYQEATLSLNQTRSKAFELMENISGIRVTGRFVRAKQLMLTSLRLLINNIDRVVTDYNRIMYSNRIVIKGVIVDVESNTSFTVWGVPFGMIRGLSARHGGWNALSPVPLTWHVYINENTTVRGNIKLDSPVIVIGRIANTTGSLNNIDAEKVLVYPFFVPLGEQPASTTS